MFAVANDGNTVGAQNVQAAELILEQLRIPVVRGTAAATRDAKMRFDLATGGVTIDIVGAASITL